MKITLLGTGGPRPDPRRHGPALVVTVGDEHLLFDAGRGVVRQLTIAGVPAAVVNPVYAVPSAYNGPTLALATVCFALQIYCDFSAYSDMAVGTAKLFGFRLMRNFAYPYFSQSVTEFWRRWHISLSTWFRDYVFIPLGGSRVGRGRLAFNLLVTFVLSGFWHGASWCFVIWGALHGLAMLPSALSRRRGALKSTDVPAGEGLRPSWGTALKMLGTFAFVCLTWVFFRAETPSQAFLILSKIATDFGSGAPVPGAIPAVTLLGLVALLLTAEWAQRRHDHPLVIDLWPRPLRWGIYTTVVWLALLLGPREMGPFIYFQF